MPVDRVVDPLVRHPTRHESGEVRDREVVPPERAHREVVQGEIESEHPRWRWRPEPRREPPVVAQVRPVPEPARQRVQQRCHVAPSVVRRAGGAPERAQHHTERSALFELVGIGPRDVHDVGTGDEVVEEGGLAEAGVRRDHRAGTAAGHRA